mmetsp:Transcript_72036/g.154230  ORF Transcript_72036/g.154230 Transcript_72036/m.154230 type:complete len:236 (+) Transcript_72036:1-708(+)
MQLAQLAQLMQLTQLTQQGRHWQHSPLDLSLQPCRRRWRQQQQWTAQASRPPGAQWWRIGQGPLAAPCGLWHPKHQVGLLPASLRRHHPGAMGKKSHRPSVAAARPGVQNQAAGTCRPLLGQLLPSQPPPPWPPPLPLPPAHPLPPRASQPCPRPHCHLSPQQPPPYPGPPHAPSPAPPERRLARSRWQRAERGPHPWKRQPAALALPAVPRTALPWPLRAHAIPPTPGSRRSGL